MRTLWIVAADSSACRIFAADTGELRELEVLSHPEARLREQELVSDLPGRTFDSAGPGRHAKEAEVSPKKHEAIQFAGRIVQRLEAARAGHEFERLAIVAAPELLGLLRDKLTPGLRALVVHEADKNITRLDPKDIRSRIPEELFGRR
ncbi:MAG TPA: host attachment protein [Burkholderiales bacterium]|nr:host attachment protein [Burkholderiales bacterium]